MNQKAPLELKLRVTKRNEYRAKNAHVYVEKLLLDGIVSHSRSCGKALRSRAA